jgi:hypothetical protein
MSTNIAEDYRKVIPKPRTDQDPLPVHLTIVTTHFPEIHLNVLLPSPSYSFNCSSYSVYYAIIFVSLL